LRAISAIGRLIVEFCDSAIDFAFPPDNVPDEDEPKSAIQELHHVFFVSEGANGYLRLCRDPLRADGYI